MREKYNKKVLTRLPAPIFAKPELYPVRRPDFSVSHEVESGQTVHCQLDKLRHQSAVLPENGTGNDSARLANVSYQPHRDVSDGLYKGSYMIHSTGQTPQTTVIYEPLLSKEQLSRLVSNESKYRRWEK